MIYPTISAVLVLSYLTSVFSASIPAAHIKPLGSDTSGALFQASSSNLSAPPGIPGFHITLHADTAHTLIPQNIFLLTVNAISHLASEPPEEGCIGEGIMALPSMVEELVITPRSNEGQMGALRMKHLVQTICQGANFLRLHGFPDRYEIQGKFPKIDIAMYDRDAMIGIMRWQNRTMSASNKANTIAAFNFPNHILGSPATNTSAYLPTVQPEQPLNIALIRSGELTPRLDDRRYKIQYRVYDRDVSLPETWTAFLNAIATASPYDLHTTGAFAVGISTLRDVAVDMRGIGNGLRWGDLVLTLKTIWVEMMRTREFKVWAWDLTFNGRKLGQGYINANLGDRSEISQT